MGTGNSNRMQNSTIGSRHRCRTPTFRCNKELKIKHFVHQTLEMRIKYIGNSVRELSNTEAWVPG